MASSSNDDPVRVQRALTQKIYMISDAKAPEYIVAGVTDHYEVHSVKGSPEEDRCTCPDYTRRELPCKHIYWMRLRWHPLEEKPATKKRRTYKDEDCSICLDPLEHGKEDVYTCHECDHGIHMECLTIWARHSMTNKQCPMCRTDIVKSMLKKRKF